MTIRLGVIGAGDVAWRDYLPEIGRLTGASVEVITSMDGRRARDAATHFSIPRWGAGVDAVLEADVDAVVNLTPSAAHASINRQCIGAGKHVYSEKPFAATLSDADELINLAAQRGVTLVCAPSVMVFPQVRRADETIHRGDVGTVWSVVGQFLGGRPPWDGYASDPTPFFAAGAGPLRDIGVYPLHAVTGLIGPAHSVVAYSVKTQASFQPDDGPMARRRVPVVADDLWHVMLRLRGDVIATLRSDFATAGTTAIPDVEINGEGGSLSLALIDMTAPLVVHRGGTTETFLAPNARAEGPDHLLGVQHLVDCLTHGTSNLLSAEHARHVIEIIEAAERSATTGNTVHLTTTF